MEGNQLKESQAINRSLLALGDVIQVGRAVQHCSVSSSAANPLEFSRFQEMVCAHALHVFVLHLQLAHPSHYLQAVMPSWAGLCELWCHLCTSLTKRSPCSARTQQTAKCEGPVSL